MTEDPTGTAEAAEKGGRGREKGDMTDERRFEALALADGDRLELLADAVLAAGASVDVVAGPEAVTTPLRLPVPGTSGTATIGHVALATCQVVVEGVRGDGCRPGRDLRGALAAAVCDAEVRRAGDHAASVEELAEQALAAAAATRMAQARQVALTRLEGTP